MREGKRMRNFFLLLAVVGTGVGCSGSQGGLEQDSAPDYEIVSEQEKDASNLKTKTITVSTESIKEQRLRQIATEIKGENTGYDALRIHFQRDTQGKSAPQDTGTAIVVNNEEAANEMLPDILFTDADRKKILNENDGILVITQAEMKRAEQEMQKVAQEMQEDMKQQTKEMNKKMDQDLNELDQETQEMQEEMEQDLREMEKELEKEMPKP
jgi:hypothetical protein